VPDGCPVLSCVANLRPVKDHETLLRALALVKQRGIPFRALLAGDGPLRFALEDVAASLDLSEEVRFLGQLAGDDVAHLFQATDIALLTSRVEGLPTALLEAMACGCAVVATDVGGTPELVEHGTTGLLVEPGNVEAVAAAVEDLLRHAARLDEMRGAARRRVEERFSLDRMIEEYESLLARLSRSEA
jgi:glycosyltransferase involved in cell wall biosynthesis